MSNNQIKALRLSNEESNKVTKESIQTALVLLMKDKDFENISITEIVKKAGVSRTAYYRNYQTKEDILNNMLNDIATNIYTSMNNKYVIGNKYEYWLNMFNSLIIYKDPAKLLFSAHFGEVIENRIFDMLIAEYDNPENMEKYSVRFWSGAICSIIKQWSLNDMKELPIDMATICCNVNSD